MRAAASVSTPDSSFAKGVDDAVARLFLDTVKPPEIELGLAVVREVERQASDVDRQWTLRLERAEYEARMAERRYKAVDPDNRVVARTLERDPVYSMLQTNPYIWSDFTYFQVP